MKKYLPPRAIKEMQIKVKLWFYSLSLEQLPSRMQTKTNAGEDVAKRNQTIGWNVS
jgi:hypothetical protein